MPDPIPHLPDQLLRRLAKVYPNGIFEEIDHDAVLSEEEVAAVADVLRPVRTEACLHPQRMWDNAWNTEVVYTLEETMPPAEWIGMRDDGKHAWLAINGCDGFVLWFLELSKVAPFYHCWFNKWVPCGDTGHFDCECPQDPPSLRWAQATAMFHNAFSRLGWARLTPELARMKHPTITAFDWDDPEFEVKPLMDDDDPPRKPALLHHLLFGEG